MKKIMVEITTEDNIDEDILQMHLDLMGLTFRIINDDKKKHIL